MDLYKKCLLYLSGSKRVPIREDTYFVQTLNIIEKLFRSVRDMPELNCPKNGTLENRLDQKQQ